MDRKQVGEANGPDVELSVPHGQGAISDVCQLIYIDFTWEKLEQCDRLEINSTLNEQNVCTFIFSWSNDKDWPIRWKRTAKISWLTETKLFVETILPKEAKLETLRCKKMLFSAFSRLDTSQVMTNSGEAIRLLKNKLEYLWFEMVDGRKEVVVD